MDFFLIITAVMYLSSIDPWIIMNLSVKVLTYLPCALDRHYCCTLSRRNLRVQLTLFQPGGAGGGADCAPLKPIYTSVEQVQFFHSHALEGLAEPMGTMGIWTHNDTIYYVPHSTI